MAVTVAISPLGMIIRGRGYIFDPTVIENHNRQLVLFPEQVHLYKYHPGSFLQTPTEELEKLLQEVSSTQASPFSLVEVERFYVYLDKHKKGIVKFLADTQIPASKITYGICDCISHEEIVGLLKQNAQGHAEWFLYPCIEMGGFDKKISEWFEHGKSPTTISMMNYT